MKFGKLEDISRVDFSLPPDPPMTRELLQAIPPRQGPIRLYIGGTGWSRPHWKGSLYPKGSATKEFLRHYGEQFDTIELNATHYRVPDDQGLAQWRNAVPESFRFCPKVPQDISHRLRLVHAEEATAAFCNSMAVLRPKLGPCFLQLPPNFGPNEGAKLMKWLAHWPVDMPLAVEFRHPDWFGRNAHAEAVHNALQARRVGMVITDVAGRRDVLHMRLTAPWLILRFVGNGLHPTDYQRWADWVARLRQWSEEGLRAAFLLLHQPEDEGFPEFSLEAARMLNAGVEGAAKLPTLHSDDGLFSDLIG